MGGKKQGQFACDFVPWQKAVSFVASCLLSPATVMILVFVVLCRPVKSF